MPRDRLGGTIQADILKEYIAQKEWCFPVDPAMRLLGDMIEWSARELPRWHPVSISRLPHPRGRLDRRAGARVHAQGRADLRRAGGRARARRRRLRAAAELLLQRAHRLLRGDREVPRGAPDLGARAARDLRRAQPEVVADAHARADRGRLADGPAAAQQHRPHGDRGARRRARRHPVAAHQLLRRGARAPDRGGGARRAAHAAGDRARDRRDEHDRPARRLLLRRGADRPARGARLRRTSPRSTSSAAWSRPSSAASRSARSPTPPTAPAGVSTHGARIVVGVNDFTEGGEGELELLHIDPALERKQIDRVQAVRARRDCAAVEAALGALREAAAGDAQPDAEPSRLRARTRHRRRDRRGLQQVFGTYTETPVF